MVWLHTFAHFTLTVTAVFWVFFSNPLHAYHIFPSSLFFPLSFSGSHLHPLLCSFLLYGTHGLAQDKALQSYRVDKSLWGKLMSQVDLHACVHVWKEERGGVGSQMRLSGWVTDSLRKPLSSVWYFSMLLCASAGKRNPLFTFFSELNINIIIFSAPFFLFLLPCLL